MNQTGAKDTNEEYATPSGVRRALAASLMESETARARKPGSTFAEAARSNGRAGDKTVETGSLTRPLAPAAKTRQTTAQPSKAARRASLRAVPRWRWIAAGAGAAIGLAWLLMFLFTKDPGFVLIVKGAPAGSDLFVDNRAAGQQRADGTIRVMFLEAGKRVVRVSHDGFDDFNTSVAGKDGETKSVLYAAQPTAGGSTRDPAEIDYAGSMILVKAGEFIMGDDGHEQNEKPAHKVTLLDYYIDKFEVTNAQYRKFCDETRRPYPTNPHWEPQYFSDSPNAPVVGVNWNDAMAYARWAGKRLPTEEEWEKAASWDPAAQQKRQWPWGNSTDAGRIALGSDHPDMVGRQPAGASAYGAEDMAGSVAEWVDAFYQPYPGNQAADPNFGARNRVVRGGHFRLDINDVRTTARYYHGPEFESAEKKLRSWLTGFRCAVSADDPRLREFLKARAGK